MYIYMFIYIHTCIYMFVVGQCNSTPALYVYTCLSLSLSLSLSLFVRLSLTHSLTHSLTLSLSLTLTHSLSIPVSLSLSLFRSLSLSLSLSLTHSLTHSLSPSLSLSVCLSLLSQLRILSTSQFLADSLHLDILLSSSWLHPPPSKEVSITALVFLDTSNAP